MIRLTAITLAAALAHRVGFRDADRERPVAEFSGGWRMRLNLARALICRTDLLPLAAHEAIEQLDSELQAAP